MRLFLFLACAALTIAVTNKAAAQWNPHRQFAFAEEKCAVAQSGSDKDECQYLAEMLIDDLRRCMRRPGPLAAECASMLDDAKEMLAEVNRDPVLLQHRAWQRAQQGQPYQGPPGFNPVPSPGRNCAPVQGQWFCN
jgi:hypothetical protein